MLAALEKLIIEGKANFVNYNLGASQLFRIPVERTKILFITQVIVHPYVTAWQNEADEREQSITQNIVQELRLQSSKSQNSLVYRAPINNIYNYQQGPQQYSPLMGGPLKFDVHFVHTDTVNVSIIRIPTRALWTFDNVPQGNNSNEPATPDGYGGFDTLQRLVFDAGAGAHIFPMGYENSNPAVLTPFSARSREELSNDVDNSGAVETSELTQVDPRLDDYTYPIINIFGVLANVGDFPKLTGSN